MAVYKSVRALERGLVILEAINIQDGMSTQDIAKFCDLPRPTTFRLLETLQNMGFVSQSKSDGAWHPTLRCNLLSSGFLDKAWIGQIAMPEMIKLSEKVLWPIDLATFAEDAMQVRETTHKLSPFSFDVGMVGQKIPMLHTAGGHAYLTYCPEEEREEILAIMRRSDKPEHALAHDTRAINTILERTKERGLGFRTEGYKSHTLSIAVPIFHRERVIATLAIVSLGSAISLDELIRKFSDDLRKTAEHIGEYVDRQAELFEEDSRDHTHTP